MRAIKKAIICLLIILLPVNLSGCKKSILPKRFEIDELKLVQVVGIDKAEGSSDDCMITIASKNIEAEAGQANPGNSGTGTPGGMPKALVLTSTGKTMFDAARNIQTHSDKTIFWGHSDFYLIGEEAARENIAKYIDFFTRDHELRIDSKVYIVKGSTARELIEQINQSTYFIVDKLRSLGQNLKLLSISSEIKVHELMRFIDIHHASARVPAIYLVNRSDDNGEQVKDIESYGYAIFSELKLKGFIGPDISRGLNAITNTLDSSIVTVKDTSGQDVSLEIIDCNTEVIPIFEGDNLKSITLKTRITSNVGELQSQMDYTGESSLEYMESQQSAIIKEEMESVIQKVLDYNSDCLEICDRIRLKRPYKWLKIEDQWMQIFPQIDINIQVDSDIRRSYEMREPSGYKRGE